MTSPTLAARIGSLTQSIDRLEVLHHHFEVTCRRDDETRQTLAYEIAFLHALLDRLNLDYEAARERELDYAFEAVD